MKKTKLIDMSQEEMTEYVSEEMKTKLELYEATLRRNNSIFTGTDTTSEHNKMLNGMMTGYLDGFRDGMMMGVSHARDIYGG